MTTTLFLCCLAQSGVLHSIDNSNLHSNDEDKKRKRGSVVSTGSGRHRGKKIEQQTGIIAHTIVYAMPHILSTQYSTNSRAGTSQRSTKRCYRTCLLPPILHAFGVLLVPDPPHCNAVYFALLQVQPSFLSTRLLSIMKLLLLSLLLLSVAAEDRCLCENCESVSVQKENNIVDGDLTCSEIEFLLLNEDYSKFGAPLNQLQFRCCEKGDEDVLKQLQLGVSDGQEVDSMEPTWFRNPVEKLGRSLQIYFSTSTSSWGTTSFSKPTTYSSFSAVQSTPSVRGSSNNYNSWSSSYTSTNNYLPTTSTYSAPSTSVYDPYGGTPSIGGRCNGVCRGQSIGQCSSVQKVFVITGGYKSCQGWNSYANGLSADHQYCKLLQASLREDCMCGQPARTDCPGSASGWTIWTP